MKNTRVLALKREQLAELNPAQLEDVAAAAPAPTLKDICGGGTVSGNTADSICTIRVTIDCE